MEGSTASPQVPSVKLPSVVFALAMIVKDESARITVSLDSVKDAVDVVIISDTGSTDGTQAIIKNWCEKNGKPFYLHEHPFDDFSSSRNRLLDFADDKADWLLLLDSNDELRNGGNLRKFVKSFTGEATGFYCKQEWFTGKCVDTYYNVRMVKTKYQWRYKCVVHEYIDTTPENKKTIARIDGFVLYQDRTMDNHKSLPRFKRDREMLYNEYKKNPTEPRTLFYLAQTLGCLGEAEEAYKIYQERLTCGGFIEEIFHSLLRLGDLAYDMKMESHVISGWFIRAFEMFQRAEPMAKLAEWYKDKNWILSYHYAKIACELEFPKDAILFVDKSVYDYKRWHILGICSFYAGKYEDGKEACLKAIKAGNNDIDKHNLAFYLENEKKMKENAVTSGKQKKKNDNQQRDDNHPSSPDNQDLFDNLKEELTSLERSNNMNNGETETETIVKNESISRKARKHRAKLSMKGGKNNKLF